jgi:hypothetical protein
LTPYALNLILDGTKKIPDQIRAWISSQGVMLIKDRHEKLREVPYFMFYPWDYHFLVLTSQAKPTLSESIVPTAMKGFNRYVRGLLQNSGCPKRCQQ